LEGALIFYILAKILNMNQFEFYSKWFDKEDERKINLEASLNIPIGILSVLLTVIFYFVKEFDYKNCYEVEKIFFLIFIGLSSLAALITGYFLFKSYHNTFKGFTYRGLPFPEDVHRYSKDLNQYYNENKEYFDSVGITSETLFENYLLEKYTVLTTSNIFINDNKSQNLHKSKSSLFFSIVFLIFSFIPFIYNNFCKKTEPTKVEIVKMRDSDVNVNRLNIIPMSENEKAPKMPPPPPPPPVDRVIKEGQIPMPTSNPAPPRPKD
jgi:hypothetical protein